MNIVIAGGSGFVGQVLQSYLLNKGHTITILTRNPNKIDKKVNLNAVKWLAPEAYPENELQNVDAIINLAGESINGLRWTKEKKKKILESRVTATKEIIRIISKLPKKPNVLINASAIGYYGMSETEQYTEDTSSKADDFLASVVKRWEEEAGKAKEYGVRTVFARFGLVLGTKGALPLMALPYKLRIGGKIGTGEQWVSWVHVQDVAAMLEFAIQNTDLSGPMNVTAPRPVKMSDFGRELSKILHTPYWLPVPSPVIKLGLGEMSSMLLRGQYVEPKKAVYYGFNFQYPDLEPTLKEILLK